MLVVVKNLAWAFWRKPSDVAAAAKPRVGRGWVGTEENHWSHTAKPRARLDMMGSILGVYMPMISAPSVPGSVSLKPRARSEAIAALKSTTNPLLAGTWPGCGS